MMDRYILAKVDMEYHVLEKSGVIYLSQCKLPETVDSEMVMTVNNILHVLSNSKEKG